jgi:hypothetical protein
MPCCQVLAAVDREKYHCRMAGAGDDLEPPGSPSIGSSEELKLLKEEPLDPGSQLLGPQTGRVSSHSPRNGLPRSAQKAARKVIQSPY